jgi:hypothetical protein
MIRPLVFFSSNLLYLEQPDKIELKINFYSFKFQGQVGNPDGADKPNKKFYDPRVWIRASEEAMIARANESFQSLNATNSLGDDWKC